MRRFHSILIALVLLTAHSAQGFTFWNEPRASAPLVDRP